MRKLTFEEALELKIKNYEKVSSTYLIVCPSPKFDMAGFHDFKENLKMKKMTDESAKIYSNNDTFDVLEIKKEHYTWYS
ncbi:hypothetical protein ABHQ57_03880 [Tenacibaculum sp. ZH5_bin.1]|uniref:hypothetical protein n=1 Tax=Tenacibaculum TaxID=104267 RepID=UPI0014307200|nr:hypothetical protein [Tenacibaculum mesophilum]KAF9659589.1 hypothetical protein HBA12_04925 [Tenacibaculum mesophilum]